MRLTEVLKEGKKLVSELVSELDEVELAFYQHNPADIDQITIRVIDEVVPKKADKSKLNELAEKRDELGMRLNALAKKIGDTQAELAEAKAVERTAAIEAYKAESAKQLEQIVKSIYELNTLAAKWLGLAREADRIMPNVLGYVGVSNEGLPVREIVDTTERWIQERGSYPQFTALLERAGVPSYRERMKRAKENG